MRGIDNGKRSETKKTAKGGHPEVYLSIPAALGQTPGFPRGRSAEAGTHTKVQ